MIIGREKEIQLLNSLLNSQKCEFVALYGRRRVGKTYLVDQAYKGRIFFRHTGAEPLKHPKKGETQMQHQLDAFEDSLFRCGVKRTTKIRSWREAFLRLEEHLNTAPKDRHHVLFIDEMPWMDTPRSGFLPAFSNFYNAYLCHQDNMILVCCGSASSWIAEKLIHGTKGLYRRVSRKIRLRPFSLRECKAFLEAKNCRYSDYETSLAYMAFGGIPYYLDFFQPSLSAKQNIDALLFGPDREMEDEYEELFASQFSDPESMKAIVEFLSTRNLGYDANDIAEHLKTDANGQFFGLLNTLHRSDFIMKYVPFGQKKRNVYYKLIDPFCFFYLKRVKGNEEKKNHFINAPNSPIGFAFENLCFNHLDQIETKLGISGIETEPTFYRVPKSDVHSGTQIDLIIKRKDGAIHLCEMKFYSREYCADEESHLNLENKIAAIKPFLGKKSSVHSVLVTTFGLANGMYSSDYPSVVTLADLFK